MTEGSVDRRTWLTPPEVGRRYGIKAERIIVMIRSGLIRAIDVSSSGSQRPRFRISETELQAFEKAREVRPHPPKPTKKRRPKSDVIEFF